MRKGAIKEIAQDEAEDLVRAWAKNPDYQPMDEDLAINLVCRIRDSFASRDIRIKELEESIRAALHAHSKIRPHGMLEGYFQQLIELVNPKPTGQEE